MGDVKVFAIIGLALLLGLTGYFGYNQYEQSTDLEQENEMLGQTVSNLETEKDTLAIQNSDLMSYAQTVNTELDASVLREADFQSEITRLTNDANYYKRQSEWAEYRNQEIQGELSLSVSPPYTLIQERNVVWVFKDSRGNLYEWEMPIDTYRSFVAYPEPQETMTLENDDGSYFLVKDYRQFVDSTSFAKVIDELYDNSGSDYQFLYEVWYIASQLTTYSADIGDDPRWAIETLTEAGGDCEDLTILIASMLNASSRTDDWMIKIVYFDADNPDKPETMNHVALTVETEEFKATVEATAKDNGLGYWNSINGWYFEM